MSFEGAVGIKMNAQKFYRFGVRDDSSIDSERILGDGASDCEVNELSFIFINFNSPVECPGVNIFEEIVDESDSKLVRFGIAPAADVISILADF
ncbi:MAG: hypothetical protein V2I33_17615 [Kangiellaceae bacterium]|jgi:hypothetical protein|nr:hypothetical protein [Kangiellaceae bacterium]